MSPLLPSRNLAHCAQEWCLGVVRWNGSFLGRISSQAEGGRGRSKWHKKKKGKGWSGEDPFPFSLPLLLTNAALLFSSAMIYLVMNSEIFPSESGDLIDAIFPKWQPERETYDIHTMAALLLTSPTSRAKTGNLSSCNSHTRNETCQQRVTSH